MDADAWEDIPSLTLSKSWLKLLGKDCANMGTESTVDNAEGEDLAKRLDSNLTDGDVSDWVEADSGDPRYQLLTDEEILEQVANPLTGAETESDCENEESDDIPTNGETMEMLDKCLKWYECQSEATPTSIMLLKRVRDLAAKKRCAKLRQLTLHSCL